MELSEGTKRLWGKISSDGGWLPLYVHMRDSYEVGVRLWDLWLSGSLKKYIESDVKGVGARNLVGFVCGIHDLGKAIPAFQIKKVQGGSEG
ncbi:MAG: hypothetical protein IKH98_01190 [Candidatus Methanomethylophilaceae archaeon]|nr:hypothetical protein [Candidatus Methanomethylophilaceae archaeon]